MTGWLKTSSAFLMLAAGVFVSATIDNDSVQKPLMQNPYSALEPPTFSVVNKPDQLTLDGFTSSAAHEQALSQLVAEEFSARNVVVFLRPLVALPEAWDSITTHALYAVAATESSSALVNEHTIAIRGITADNASWTSRLGALRAAVPSDIVIDDNVIAIPNLPPLADLCQRAFSRIGADNVEFRLESAEIRTSAFATLDAIVNIAYDCRDRAVAITGHSDSSGDEASNERLSLLRAKAVADYLTRGGISAERLIVIGAGSSVPVADNTTAYGRSLNRRIELELRPARPRASL